MLGRACSHGPPLIFGPTPLGYWLHVYDFQLGEVIGPTTLTHTHNNTCNSDLDV